MNVNRRKSLGAAGEKFAFDLCVDWGYSILERNYRCRFGEIDLIAVDRGELVFVEVKTRSGDACGLPEEAVNPAKQARIRRTAAHYLAEKKYGGRSVRFDVIGISVEHFENAF